MNDMNTVNVIKYHLLVIFFCMVFCSFSCECGGVVIITTMTTLITKLTIIIIIITIIIIINMCVLHSYHMSFIKSGLLPTTTSTS